MQCYRLGVFSDRTAWRLARNRLTEAVDARRRAGHPILDLTGSNPTRAGVAYPETEIAEALATPEPQRYDPDPRGEPAAREAVARWYAGRGLAVDPDRLFLTPGTSESYAWLFKLLCDPGDAILVPRPSYPLFEFLAGLESVTVASYPLRYERRWEMDDNALRFDVRSGAPIRAIVVVNPNNPTGSFLSPSERRVLGDVAQAHDLALISDEVFSSFPLDGAARAAEAGSPSAAGRVVSFLGSDDVPAFVLDGLSKSAGLPGMKAGWIAVQGPPAFRETAMARLEVIADTYLSVGTPVQRALPRLLTLAAPVAERIRERIAASAETLRRALAASPSCELLAIEGGWSAVMRVPRKLSEEALCLELLEKDGVLVQPGWFFDFEEPAYLVVSLLTPERELREGISRVLARAA
jgi:alanine-synthesizing transaminase